MHFIYLHFLIITGRTGKVLAETTKLKIMKLVGRERPIKVSIQTKCLKNWH